MVGASVTKMPFPGIWSTCSNIFWYSYVNKCYATESIAILLHTLFHATELQHSLTIVHGVNSVGSVKKGKGSTETHNGFF